MQQFRIVKDIIRRYQAGNLNEVVSPADKMWQTGPSFYFSVGESGLNCVLSALSLSWNTKVHRVLDLPCGHGRVARHFRAAFPDAEIYVCDLDRDGVDFCSAQFGLTGIYSQPELTDVSLPGDLDVIWVGSLFTHVDRSSTARWLRFLAEHLAPHGVMVATFHGLFALEVQKASPMINAPAWLQIERDFRETGYGYAAYTEFDMGDYGISLSDPTVIVGMAREIPRVRILMYAERAWANNHDVLAITRNDRLAPF